MAEQETNQRHACRCSAPIQELAKKSRGRDRGRRPCDEAELVVVALLQPALPGGHRVGRHGHCALAGNAAAGGHVSFSGTRETEVRIDRSEPHKKQKERATQEREPPLTLFCLIYRQAKRAINRDRATDREERQSKGNAVAPPLAAARDAWGGDGGNDATVLSPPDPSVNEMGKKPQLPTRDGREETGNRRLAAKGQSLKSRRACGERAMRAYKWRALRSRPIYRQGRAPGGGGRGKSMWLYCLALAVGAVIALPTTDRPRPSPSPTFE